MSEIDVHKLKFFNLPMHYVNFLIEYTKDFNHRRAAEACGLNPAYGMQLISREDIKEALQYIIRTRLESANVDATWVLNEAVNNMRIARQIGNMSASNQALNIIAKHVAVDAYAAAKVKVDNAADLVERLERGRFRAQNKEKPSFL